MQNSLEHVVVTSPPYRPAASDNSLVWRWSSPSGALRERHERVSGRRRPRAVRAAGVMQSLVVDGPFFLKGYLPRVEISVSLSVYARIGVKDPSDFFPG